MSAKMLELSINSGSTSVDMVVGISRLDTLPECDGMPIVLCGV